MRKTKQLVTILMCIAIGVAALLSTRQFDLGAAERIDLKPLAHWDFTKQPDGKDAAGLLHAKITGKPIATPDGLTLAETDRIVVRDRVMPTAAFLPKAAMSVVAWVRIDQDTEWGGIFGCLQDNGPHEKGFLLGYDKVGFSFGLAGAKTPSATGKITFLKSKTPYKLGGWHHVAAVYDGTRMKLYVDGKLDAESSEQSGDVLYADSAPLVLGRYQDDDEDFPMIGGIREVLWCVNALTAEQLKAHYTADEALALRRQPEPPRFAVEPYVQFATQTSMVVMGETLVPTEAVVEYGNSFPPMLTAKSAAKATMHEIPLIGLQPNTKYFYRMVCTDADGTVIAGKANVFQTACGPSDAYSFTIFGDTQKNPTITGKIAKLMWERRPNFVLHMGDVVDNGPDKKEWTEELFKPCNDLFGRVPVFPCIGNHEKNHAHYYQYFSLPKPEYYYKFVYGNAEFFVIDSNKPLLPGSEQYLWLDTALANSKAKWKFCYHHHPCWTMDSDDYGNTWKVNSKFGDSRARSLIPLYEKHKVDFAMNGHVHFYERSWPIRADKVDPTDGVTYLTSGGGGGKLEDFAPTPAFFKNQNLANYHYCCFNIHAGVLEAKVYDHEGRLFDQFSRKKD